MRVRWCSGYGVRLAIAAGVRGFASYSGSILIISSINTKYWFFPGNGLDRVHIDSRKYEVVEVELNL
ncbi:hypothetical protein DPMN_117306 [Dreissena polymorpha]|uniref:Uncharacterized protein n=1 Tax=Dreissena polymorpha TaxID=45954 RepID=A0A9D4KQ88_DREPO|nr:hypothetical protein DPMN_117306 [Dreissena polymorpha]